jgi:hypothetical protein
MRNKNHGRAGIVGLFAIASLFAIPVATTSAQAAVSTSAQAIVASKLGDLSQFRAIVADVSAIVSKGDFASAKARIKDLEVLWDRSETKLKPKAPADWHSLDRAIDKALYDVRQGKPNQTACQESLTALLKLLDQLSGNS